MLQVDFGTPFQVGQEFFLAGLALLLALMVVNKRFAYAVGQHLDEATLGCWRLFQKALRPTRQATDVTSGGTRITSDHEVEESVQRARRAETGDASSPLASPTGVGASQAVSSEVFMLLTRLVGGTITAAVVGGIVYIDILRIGPALFPGINMGPLLTLPIPLGTLLGTLTAALGILLGTFLAEVLGGEHVPESVQFLPPWWWVSSRRFYTRLTMTTAGLYGLYLIVVGIVAQAGALGLTFDGKDALTLLAGTLLVILAVLATVLAHYLIILWFSAIFALVFGLAGLLLKLLRLMLSPLIPRIAPLERPGVAPEERPVIGSGKWPKGEPEVEPPPPVVFLEKKRKAPPYQGSLIGFGEFGLRMLPAMLSITGAGRPKRALRLVGFCPTGTLPNRSLHHAIRKNDARDIGITPDELAAIRRTGGL
jgi:hypothetical protein